MGQGLIRGWEPSLGGGAPCGSDPRVCGPSALPDPGRPRAVLQHQGPPRAEQAHLRGSSHGAAATGLCLLGGQAEDPAAKGFDSPVSTLSFPWGSLSLTELFHGMLLLSFTVG